MRMGNIIKGLVLAAIAGSYLVVTAVSDVAPTVTSEIPPTVVSDSVRVGNGTPVSVIDAMDICGVKLSPARKAILAAQITRISARFLPREEHRQAFVGLLCIESKFQSDVHSSVGAVGLSQIMPRYASYFSEQCGLGKVEASDLLDSEVNLTLGACHFSQLLTALDGNIALAMSGYNSGQDSETTKRLAHLAEGHPETMAYVAKFYSYMQKLQLAAEPVTLNSKSNTKSNTVRAGK